MIRIIMIISVVVAKDFKRINFQPCIKFKVEKIIYEITLVVGCDEMGKGTEFGRSDRKRVFGVLRARGAIDYTCVNSVKFAKKSNQ